MKSWAFLGAVIWIGCVQGPENDQTQTEDPVTVEIQGEREQTLCGGSEEAASPISFRWLREGDRLGLEISSTLEKPARLLLSVQAGSRLKLEERDLELRPGSSTVINITPPQTLRGRRYATQLRALAQTFVGGELLGTFSAEPLYAHHEDGEANPRIYERATLKAQHRGGDIRQIALRGVPEAEIGGASMAYEIQAENMREDQP